jgi:ribosome-binding protein aMBF1 (putative translation factor)
MLRRPAPVHLRAWLDHRGLTAEQLAAKLETSKSVISKLETGDQRWNQDWLEEVAFVLDVDVPQLYAPPPATNH